MSEVATRTESAGVIHRLDPSARPVEIVISCLDSHLIDDKGLPAEAEQRVCDVALGDVVKPI